MLFVSEKAAALNVVHKRLAAVGMAPFCLSLHSTRTTREELRMQLDAALKVAGCQVSADWEAETHRLEELRAHLNGHVEALHKVRNIGHSIHWAVEILVHHRETPRSRLEMDLTAMDKTSLAKLRDAVTALKLTSDEARDVASHPLREFHASAWSMMLPADIRQAMDTLAGQIPKIEAVAAPVLMSCHIGRTGWSSAMLDFGAGLVRLLGTVPAVTSALLKNPDWSDAETGLRDWIEKGLSRDSQRAALLQKYLDSILAFDPAPHIKALQSASVTWPVKRWFLRHRVWKALKPHCQTTIADRWDIVLTDMKHLAQVQKRRRCPLNPQRHRLRPVRSGATQVWRTTWRNAQRNLNGGETGWSVCAHGASIATHAIWPWRWD